MPTEPDTALLAVLADAPIAVALEAADGTLVALSRGFQDASGVAAGAARPGWLPATFADGHVVQLGERQYEAWTRPVSSGRLVGLRDRTDLALVEDQLWEQQTRLSKVYSELSVRNTTLSQALEDLRRRETDLQELNKNLEIKVQEQIAQLERSSRLRRYVSPEVANSIMSGEGQELPTRKRLLTLFFADVAGFDEVAGEMESEEIIELLSDYQREMTGILFEHGGTLDKFISMRLMAFFGDPVPQDDHAARAVRAGLAMRERVRERKRRWFPAAQAAELQVGIHTGYATVGNVGSEHRVDYTAIGKNVSQASSLQLEAKPGQILLTGRACETVQDLFDVEVQSVVLKGSSRPITVYAVTGARGSGAEAALDGAQTRDALQAKTEKWEPGAMPGGDLTGKRLGPYLVQEKIGAGGMGVVYRARDERLQRTAALKVLPAELSMDDKFVARFFREAQALAQLSSPNIAQIYYIGEAAAPLFFAMELVDGPTLRRVLADQGRLPLRRALDLVTQIARGLQAAAEKGVIHRDIKPDNVMLTLKGQVKLTDFGLVKIAQSGSGATSRGIVLGTPLYMSPEQARGEEVDLRADIYSLGATFFHMLVGQPPFRGESAIAVLRKHEEADLPALPTLPGNVSADVYAVVRRMMAKRREDRFESYDGLLQALDAC